MALDISGGLFQQRDVRETPTADISSVVLAPIGAIIAWFKSYPNTPATLPSGWVEANGAVVNDADSVYNGQTLPDLNTNYLTISASAWTPLNSTVAWTQSQAIMQADGDAISFYAPVNLPNGATVTAVVVYGNAAATAENYALQRITTSTGAYDQNLANAAIGTVDTTITVPTIDNSLYTYNLTAASLDTNDEVWTSMITYTPRFKFIMRIK